MSSSLRKLSGFARIIQSKMAGICSVNIKISCVSSKSIATLQVPVHRFHLGELYLLTVVLLYLHSSGCNGLGLEVQ